MSHKEHEIAVNEKLVQLRALKEGRLTSHELIRMITERGVNWMKEHLDEMMAKYPGLSLPEQAYRIIYFEHMKINPIFSHIEMKNPLSLEIHSYNFCPYLEACRILHLKTTDICKKILEPPLQKMIKIISPNLHFGRDYNAIRPYHECCREFIWQAG